MNSIRCVPNCLCVCWKPNVKINDTNMRHDISFIVYNIYFILHMRTGRGEWKSLFCQIKKVHTINKLLISNVILAEIKSADLFVKIFGYKLGVRTQAGVSLCRPCMRTVHLCMDNHILFYKKKDIHMLLFHSELNDVNSEFLLPIFYPNLLLTKSINYLFIFFEKRNWSDFFIILFLLYFCNMYFIIKYDFQNFTYYFL